MSNLYWKFSENIFFNDGRTQLNIIAIYNEKPRAPDLKTSLSKIKNIDIDFQKLINVSTIFMSFDSSDQDIRYISYEITSHKFDIVESVHTTEYYRLHDTHALEYSIAVYASKPSVNDLYRDMLVHENYNQDDHLDEDELESFHSNVRDMAESLHKTGDCDIYRMELVKFNEVTSNE